jgi:hypothetical protein
MATTGLSAPFCGNKAVHPGGRPFLQNRADILQLLRRSGVLVDVTINVPSAMKLISLLSAAAFLALGVSLLALNFGAPAVGSYAAAASVLVLLGAVRDYTPRRSCWEPGRTSAARFPSASAGQPERLAA